MGDFKLDLKTGEQGEEVVFRYLQTLDTVELVEDVRKEAMFQKHDIDFLVYTKQAVIFPIEVKSDTMAHRTGNIAYEVYSNKHYGTQGCFEKTKAKYIYYYLVATKQLYKIDVQALREYVSEYFTGKPLISMGDFAEGHLLKIRELEARSIMTNLQIGDA